MNQKKLHDKSSKGSYEMPNKQKKLLSLKQNLQGFYQLKTITMTAVSIYPTPPSQAECDKRSVLEQNTNGLNLEFSFSKTGCHVKAKEPRLPYYLRISGRVGNMSFSRALGLHLRFELCKPCPFPKTITVTPLVFLGVARKVVGSGVRRIVYPCDRDREKEIPQSNGTGDATAKMVSEVSLDRE